MTTGKCDECKEWGKLSDMPTIPGESLCIKCDDLLQQQVQEAFDWEEAKGYISAVKRENTSALTRRENMSQFRQLELYRDDQ